MELRVTANNSYSEIVGGSDAKLSTTDNELDRTVLTLSFTCQDSSEQELLTEKLENFGQKFMQT